jgi:hypothetical protein
MTYIHSEFPLMLSLVRNDILFATVVGVSFAFLVVRTGRRRLPYPPGPRRLPIVGNLFSMPSQEEWVTYWKWSKDCGMGRSQHSPPLPTAVLNFIQDLTLYMSM